MKKYEVLDGKIFVLVPVLREKTRSPLTYSARLVYGYLVYRCGKNGGATCPEISRRLHIDCETTRRAVKLLADLGLASKTGHEWRAVEPTGPAREFFRWQKKADGPWQKTLVYDRTYLPSAACPFGLKANAMFWWLVKMAAPADGLRNCMFITYPAFLTIEYLTNGLHFDPKTIRTALKELQKVGLVHVVRSGSRSKGFQVGLRIHRRCESWWRNEWEKNTAVPLTARELFGMPSNYEVKEDVTAQPEAVRYLLKFGIPPKIATQITAIIEQHLIPPREWKAMLDRIRRDHEANRMDKPDYPAHCGKLFLHQLMANIQQEQAKSERFSRTGIRTSDEMRGEEAVRQLSQHEQVVLLLHNLIGHGQVVLDDDMEMPVRIGWDEIPEMVKESMWSKNRFKEMLLERVFGSTDPVPCLWYRRWVAA